MLGRGGAFMLFSHTEVQPEAKGPKYGTFQRRPYGVQIQEEGIAASLGFALQPDLTEGIQVLRVF